jgi:hypothetical protein
MTVTVLRQYRTSRKTANLPIDSWFRLQSSFAIDVFVLFVLDLCVRCFHAKYLEHMCYVKFVIASAYDFQRR